MGSRELGGGREVPRVSATCSCSFLIYSQRCAQAGIIFHINLLDSAVRHAAQLTHSRGVKVLVSLYQCPAADLELLFKWRIVIFSSCASLLLSLRICARILFLGSDPDTPALDLWGYLVKGSQKHTQTEVQVVF